MAKQKRQPRKKRRTKKSTSSQFKFINLVLLMMILTLSITIAAYFLIFDNHKKNTTPTSTKTEKSTDEFSKEKLNKYFEEFKTTKETKQITSQEKLSIIEKTIPNPKEDSFEEYTKEFEKEYINLQKIKQQEVKKVQPKTHPSIIDNRPKLSIVIDDVTLQSQINKILDIGYTITMSFMPPTRQHPNSAKIAQNLPFYMIHLPLQAKFFKFEEENTLHVGDSYEKIEKRVKIIRELYPAAIYVNNHTGSKFTSDDVSMERLIRALKKYDFQFVDSRTTAHSVVKKYTDKNNMPYIARNIFLDNNKDFNYIQNQLKKAIRIAKKTGSAIAIGHPYAITIKVLKESKPLLEGLNLVYINEIPVH